MDQGKLQGLNELSRTNHAGKPKTERDYYVKAIQRQDYDPTIDDSISFPNTDDADEDLSVSKTKRLQKVGAVAKIGLYLAEHWVEFLVSAIAFLFVFFVFNVNRDLGRVEGVLQSVDANHGRLETDIQSIDKAGTETRRLIDSMSVRLEFLRRDIDRLMDVDPE